MEVFQFKCSSCGYESKHSIGTPQPDQILTDVNTEFADYRLFKCPHELKFVHADILDKNFSKRCPVDGNELSEISSIPPQECPRCNQQLEVKVSKPLNEE